MTVADDRDPVGERLHLGEDVAGEQHGAPGGLGLVDDLLEDSFHERIQPSGGLIQQKQIDLRGQGCDQRDLLAVPLGIGPGLLPRVQVEAFDQLIPMRRIEGAAAAGTAAGTAAQPQEHIDGLAAGEVGPELDVAGDIGQATVKLHRVPPRIAAEELDGPGVRAQQSQQHAHRGGLPGAVGSQEAVHLSRCDVQIQIIEGANRSERLDQGLSPDDRGVLAHRSVPL